MINEELIKEVDPSKDCLDFLIERIRSDNYRGVQISQHNRYTFEQIVDMLKIMNSLVGEGCMQIRTTDLKKRPHNIPGEETYSNYTNLVNKKYGKSTQDSIRKNLFVDLHRMGLINRYNENKISLGPYERGTKKYVSLTNLGHQLIRKENTELQKYMIFSRAINNLLKDFAIKLLDIIAQLDYITLDEFMLFASFLDKELNGQIINIDLVKKYILDYRSLSFYQKKDLIEKIKKICDPSIYNGNKKTKRDFHNWRNESQQIMMILNMTIYYEYNYKQEKLWPRIGKNYLFEDKSKLKRSLNEKYKYFERHGVNKKLGFELHHIVPLSWAKTKEEFFLFDKWTNLAYLDGFSHSKITQNQNKNVKLEFQNNDVKFIDFDKNIVFCEENKNIKYNIGLKNKMKKKNENLLENIESF